MLTFSYKAYKVTSNNNSHAIITGKIVADSERQAKINLTKQGLQPIEIKKTKNIKIFAKNKINNAELASLTRQLATMLSAGVTLENSLEGIINQTSQEKTKNILTNIRQKILEGFSFAEALNEHSNSFSQLYCATVAAGEQSSKLSQILTRLADYTEKQEIIKQKIQHALIYPSFMFFLSLAIMFFLLTNIVPSLTEAFINNDQPLPIATQILMKISDFLVRNKAIILIVSFLLIFLSKLLFHKPKYRFYFDKNILKIPLLKKLIANINIARYLKTFSILFEAGVDIIKTMEVSKAMIENQQMAKTFTEANIQVKEGVSISQALYNTKFIKPTSLHLIASGEKSGSLGIMMDKAGEQLNDEINHLINTGLTMLEPIIIVFMGLLVFFIVMATLLPIFSMQTLIN